MKDKKILLKFREDIYLVLKYKLVIKSKLFITFTTHQKLIKMIYHLKYLNNISIF